MHWRAYYVSAAPDDQYVPLSAGAGATTFPSFLAASIACQQWADDHPEETRFRVTCRRGYKDYQAVDIIFGNVTDELDTIGSPVAAGV
jgi:hypothetical protein